MLLIRFRKPAELPTDLGSSASAATARFALRRGEGAETGALAVFLPEFNFNQAPFNPSHSFLVQDSQKNFNL
jgi:hypothetical protein